MVHKYDFLIIGAGVAGMSYALKVAREKKGKICMICKTSLEEANTSPTLSSITSTSISRTRWWQATISLTAPPWSRW